MVLSGPITHGQGDETKTKKLMSSFSRSPLLLGLYPTLINNQGGCNAQLKLRFF